MYDNANKVVVSTSSSTQKQITLILTDIWWQFYVVYTLNVIIELCNTIEKRQAKQQLQLLLC